MPPDYHPTSRRAALIRLGLCGLAGYASDSVASPPKPQVARFALASEAPTDIDPSGFLVSEKLDGVRAQWDGRRLRFRSGREITPPAWFTAELPDVALDGELWMGRGRFDAVSATVRRASADATAWRSVRWMLFDLPGAPGGFAERSQRLARLGRRLAPWIGVLPQERLHSPAALQRRLDSVCRSGGEGLVLHRLDAPWQAGRSQAILKLKPLHDAEAQVLAHLPGQGRLAGQLGALLVRTPDGVEFRLGSGFDDALRRHPPAVGSWITFRHRGWTAAGVPRFASYWRRFQPET